MRVLPDECYQLVGALPPLADVFDNGVADHLVKPCGQLFCLPCGHHVVGKDAAVQCDECGHAVEWQPSGDEFIEHHAKREDVAALQGIACQQFRGCVGRGCSVGHHGEAQCGMLHKPGHTEAAERSLAIFVEIDVVRVDVAVYHVLVMYGLQGFGHVKHHVHFVALFQRATPKTASQGVFFLPPHYLVVVGCGVVHAVFSLDDVGRQSDFLLRHLGVLHPVGALLELDGGESALVEGIFPQSVVGAGQRLFHT